MNFLSRLSKRLSVYNRPVAPDTQAQSMFSPEYCRNLVNVTNTMARYGDPSKDEKGDVKEYLVGQYIPDVDSVMGPLGNHFEALAKKLYNGEPAEGDIEALNIVIRQLNIAGARMDGLSSPRVLFPEFTTEHYEEARRLKTQINLNSNDDLLRPEQRAYWGSRRQILYGVVVSDLFRTHKKSLMHPITALLLNPDGGLVGPGNSRFGRYADDFAAWGWNQSLQISTPSVTMPAASASSNLTLVPGTRTWRTMSPWVGQIFPAAALFRAN